MDFTPSKNLARRDAPSGEADDPLKALLRRRAWEEGGWV